MIFWFNKQISSINTDFFNDVKISHILNKYSINRLIDEIEFF